MGKQCDGSSSRLMGYTWLNVILIIVVILWAVLGLTKVIIGGIYINDCSEEEMIPVWLIVDALIPIIFVIGFVFHLKEGSTNSLKLCGSVCLVVAMVLSLGWSIAGAVWIYPNWNDDGDCDRVVEVFAFAMITVNWTIVWIWLNISARLLARHCCSEKC